MVKYDTNSPLTGSVRLWVQLQHKIQTFPEIGGKQLRLASLFDKSSDFQSQFFVSSTCISVCALHKVYATLEFLLLFSNRRRRFHRIIYYVFSNMSSVSYYPQVPQRVKCLEPPQYWTGCSLAPPSQHPAHPSPTHGDIEKKPFALSEN
jgi:hypothetical protein